MMETDRNAVIRECVVTMKHHAHNAVFSVGLKENPSPSDYSVAVATAISEAANTLIEGDE